MDWNGEMPTSTKETTMSDAESSTRRLVDTHITRLAEELKDMLTVGCRDEGFKALLYDKATSLYELDHALTRFLDTTQREETSHE